MLQSMREKTKGFVAIFLVVLLVIPLALIGVESLFYNNNQPSDVGEVNGQVISEREVQIGIARERQRLQSQFGENLPADFVSDERLRPLVIDALVQRLVMTTFADDQNMAIPVAVVDKQITDLPDFQTDGVFDQQKFVRLLRNIGHTPTSFRQLLKDDILVSQLRSAILTSGFTTDKEFQETIALSKQQRDFSWVSLPAAKLVEKASVSDEEVAQHYEDNKATYLSKEQVAIEYISLNIADLMAKVVVDEALVRERFDEVLKRFSAQVQYDVAHIMIEKGTEDATKKVSELEQALAQGKAFEALAKTHSDDFGSRMNGGRLGVSAVDGLPDGFAQVVENLAEGQVSDAVELETGIHFIKLLARVETSAPTFDEKKQQIEQELKRELAQEKFAEDVQLLEELAYNASSLMEVGEQMDIEAQKTGLFSRTEGHLDEVLGYQQVVGAAFSEQVLLDKNSSDLIELSPERVVVIKMLDHEPVRVLSLEEKQADIVARLKGEKAQEQLIADADFWRKAFDAGEDVATLAKEKGVSFTTKVGVQRHTSEVPSELLSKVFDMPVPVEKASVLTDELSSGDYVVVHLVKVTAGDSRTLSEAERDNLQRSLSTGLAGSEYQAWLAQLQSDSDVELHELNQ